MSRALQTRGFTGLAAIVLLSTVPLQPAAARIRCEGEFQVTQYGLVVRLTAGRRKLLGSQNSYGSRVSAAECHNNPLTKVYLCQDDRPATIRRI